ncbi:MAG: L-threonylcarbamoyladenylate synthase [Bacteroidia bacterium]
MTATILRVYPENPAPRHIRHIVDLLRDGGIIIYPTDTVYALGCDMANQSSIDRLCRIVGKKPEQANLALICEDLSNISFYTKQFENPIFKMMKKALPGPYTFILNANSNVPKLFKNKKREIGIRVPDNNIPRALVKELGHPIITTSLSSEDEITRYFIDPEEMLLEYKNLVDLVIDGGPGGTEASTVIDCTGNEVAVVREGKGPIDILP